MNQELSNIGWVRRPSIATEKELPAPEHRVAASSGFQPAVRNEPALPATFPFTTLEEWLFWEDRPAYPWSCFARLRLAGQLDCAAFETAVREVLPRHPLFCARVRAREGMHPEWVVQNDPQPILTWRSGPLGGPFPTATPIDLLHEIGIRFHVVSNGPACDLILQWHHACCDGVGVLSFIDELLIAYALAFGGAPDGLQLPLLEPERLASRGQFGLTLRKVIHRLPGHIMGLPGAARFLLRVPASLVPHEPCEDDGPLPPRYPTTLTGVLEREQLARLRKTATQRGTRLNDLMVAELFLALAEWRARWNIPDNDERLRIMIPINLRTPADRRLPAASLASFLCVDARRQDFTAPARLLNKIHKEITAALNRRLGFTFVFSCQMLNLIPGKLRAHIRKPRCLVSCVLTNLGKALVRSPLPRRAGNLAAGNVTLEGIDGVAPLRPHTCASFTAIAYARRLSITLHYDPRPLTEPQAADLLKTFLTRLRTL